MSLSRIKGGKRHVTNNLISLTPKICIRWAGCSELNEEIILLLIHLVHLFSCGKF